MELKEAQAVITRLAEHTFELGISEHHPVARAASLRGAAQHFPGGRAGRRREQDFDLAACSRPALEPSIGSRADDARIIEDKHIRRLEKIGQFAKSGIEPAAGLAIE